MNVIKKTISTKCLREETKQSEFRCPGDPLAQRTGNCDILWCLARDLCHISSQLLPRYVSCHSLDTTAKIPKDNLKSQLLSSADLLNHHQLREKAVWLVAPIVSHFPE